MNGLAKGTPAEGASRAGAGPARLEILALLAVLAFALWLRLRDFNDPFGGVGWSTLSARLAIQARNFAENGYATSRLAPTIDQVPPADGLWQAYVNHPPLLSLVLSVAFRVLGTHEWTGRLVMVVSSIGALLALWALARRMFGPQAAFVAAALGATIPITAYYGTLMNENGSLLLLFLACALVVHAREIERPTRGGLVMLILCLVLAALTDWQGHLLMGALAVHELWLGRRARAAALGGALLAMFALHAAWVLAVSRVSLGGGSNGGGEEAGLVSVFWHRSWGGVDTHGGALRVLRKLLGRYLMNLYTLPVLALAALGLLQLRRAASPSLLVTLLLFGFGDLLVFAEGAVRHEFWNVTLAPALLTLAGAGAAGTLAALRPAPLRAASVGLLALTAATFGARATLARFAMHQDDLYYVQLGQVIEDHSRPGDFVATCENWSDSLSWYARRTLVCDLTDRVIPESGLPDSLAPMSVFVLPERSYAPPAAHHEHAHWLALLRAAYPDEVVDTQGCGRVHVFDLRRRLP
jgi:4-amino-4-deoxy-L-arabinose transferase-like glycosyltransferase